MYTFVLFFFMYPENDGGTFAQAYDKLLLYYYYTVALIRLRSAMDKHPTSVGHPEFVSLWVTLTPPRFHTFTNCGTRVNPSQKSDP